VLEPASVALKFGFLVVLYLTVVWVARSALRDLRRGAGQTSAVAADATGLHNASVGLGRPGLGADADPRLRVEQAAGLREGDEYDVLDGVILGRGTGAEIRIDDPYASSVHARITRQGDVMVVEDLNSTNGTYLNDELLAGPQPLHSGDVIRIGSNEFTYLH
jgi:hypothetical protein